MRRAPPWGRRTPHRGSRPAGVRAGGRRRGLPPARDVARAPAPSSARARSKARGRRAVAPGGAGGARSAPPAPLGPCPVCVNPMRRRIELRLFQGAAAAPALRGLGRCGLSAADVRAHFESGHFHPDPPLLIATLVDLLSRARADGGPAGEGKDASLASINQGHKLRLEIIKLIAAIAGNSHGSAAPQFVSQTIGMLLSEQQAVEMRKLAASRPGGKPV